MTRRILGGPVLALALTLTGLSPQNSESKIPGQSFSFRRGQAVYLAAFRQVIHREHAATDHTVNIVQELDVERRIRKEFEALQIFKVVDKPSEAEFVFLVYVDGSTAEGLALAPEKYAQYKGKFDLDALREAAWARALVGPYKIPTLGKISNQLAKKFHETVRVGKTTS